MKLAADYVPSSVSKFSLSRLALQSALELEKAKRGRPFRGEILGSLAEALSQTSYVQAEGARLRSIRAGYHRPLVRLYMDRRLDKPKSMADIQSFVAEAADDLKEFGSSETTSVEADQLIAFCTSLHRELVNGLSSENRLVLRQRKTPRATPPRVGSPTA